VRNIHPTTKLCRLNLKYLPPLPLIIGCLNITLYCSFAPAPPSLLMEWCFLILKILNPCTCVRVDLFSDFSESREYSIGVCCVLLCDACYIVWSGNMSLLLFAWLNHSRAAWVMPVFIGLGVLFLWLLLLSSLLFFSSCDSVEYSTCYLCMHTHYGTHTNGKKSV
jgi:hypothetical protein